jgi:glycosyltransferase involved in cell wall biosynthesis
VTDTPQPKKLNLLLLTTELRPGGAEKCLVQLAINLDPELFKVIIVTLGSKPSSSEDRLVQQLEAKAIEHEFLNCDSKFKVLTAVKRLRNIIEKKEIDVVQSFLFHANVVAGMAIGNSCKVRFFTGIRVAEPSRIRHRIERWATKRAEKIICVSQAVMEFASEKMGLPCEKLLTIPNGILPVSQDQNFHPDEVGISQPYVVFVGRLHQQKGLIPFFEKFLEWEDTLPDFDLVIVGEGPDRHRLECLSREFSRHRVRFLGWRDDPASIISEAITTILPSQWEGMPNVLLETMALSKPFVAFAIDGVSELGSHEKRQLVSPEDYQQFFQKLAEVVDDQSMAEELGKKNHQRIQQDFTLKKMIADYQTAYLSFAKPLM